MKLTIVTFLVLFLALARGQGRDCDIPDHSVCKDVSLDICDDDVLARNLCPYRCGICNSPTAAPTEDSPTAAPTEGDCNIPDHSVCNDVSSDICEDDVLARNLCPNLCGICNSATPAPTEERMTTLATTVILSTPEVVDESVICELPDADDCTHDDCGSARERTVCPHICGHCGEYIPIERTTVLSTTLTEDFTSTDSPTTDTTMTRGTSPPEVCEDLVDNPLICLTNDFCSDPYADEVCRKSCNLCGAAACVDILPDCALTDAYPDFQVCDSVLDISV